MDSPDKKEESDPMINKTILHPGVIAEKKTYPDGTKVTFHFRTEKCNEGKTLIDDSRKLGKPMEIILGKKFKLEIWEAFVKTMAPKEIAHFRVDQSLVRSYPLIAKTLRTALSGRKSPNEHQANTHCCGMMALQKDSLGHADLDELVKNPQDLGFIFEILKIEEPGNYEKESWAMNEEEKLNSVPRLREEGNEMYKEKRYIEAARRYAEALGRLEQLQLREKPGDEEWVKLDQMKIPLLLNYSQCQLIDGDFYSVIEHTTTVIDKDPDNVKALFRRAKAHVGAWNPTEAKADYEKVKKLDASLAPAVDKELQNLEKLIKDKENQDKLLFKGKIFQ